MSGFDSDMLRSLVETVPDGLVVVDDKGAAVCINRTARDILKVEDSFSVSAAFLADRLECSPPACEAQTEQEVTISDTLFHVIISPLYNRGRKAGAAVFLRDASGLQEAEEIKTDFVSVASHELRNPLTALKNSLNILMGMDDAEIRESRERFLGIASRNADRILTLINQYLDIARVETGKMSFEFKQLDAAAFLKGVVRDFGERAERAGIELKLDIPDELPEALADPPKLEQILFNLIGNAVKFTKPGGWIEVSAQEVPAGSAGAPGSDRPMLQISVTDTGVGIPKEKRNRIFEKFYRIRQSMEVDREGVGLGLAIVNKLVELHGGAIGVEENQPAGSRFWFSVPVYTSERRDPAFRWIFDRELEKAKKSMGALSLIMVTIDDICALRQIAGGQEVDRLVKSMESSVLKSLYRQEDVVVQRKEGEMFIAFCQADKPGAASISSRIRTGIAAVLERSPAARDRSLRVQVGSATYPEDADSQRDLYRIALKNSMEDQDGEEKNSHC